MLPALLALLLPLASHAADPVPVLKCPAVPESYSKMLTSLKVLQTQIKRDANGSCDPVRDEVIDLEKLLGERRKAVVDIIDRSKKEPLDSGSLDTVRSYVNDVTTKVLNTAELIDRSNNCFEEDKKQFGFGELASITLDATALAKTVAGPWSAPVALGGQALAGIFQGLERVVKNKRGFDFEKLDQRQSFVQSLCSYYNYRQDMENLMFPSRRASQLRKLEAALKANLDEMTKSCPECEKLVGDVANETQTSEVNKLATQTDRTYVRPLGTYTVQSVSAMAWVRAEGQRLRDETGDEFGIGRDLLSEKAADMDQFFFEKEAPRFLKAQNEKSYKLISEYSSYARSTGLLFAYEIARYVNLGVPTYNLNETEILELVTSFRDQVEAKGQSQLAYRIDDFERKSLDLLDRSILALQVQDSYCRFFQKAGYYNANLQYYCQGSTAAKVRGELARLEQSRNVMKTAAAPSAVRAAAPARGGNLALSAMIPLSLEEMSTDWADSLTKIVNHLRKDPFRFQKR
ncbi:MAG: hypothetical protein EOP11_00415 [Proteobacteria bacterium]|nr:MAG: hypothetical protein EOP11_00415 [Pseudomonadota bacterium]